MVGLKHYLWYHVHKYVYTGVTQRHYPYLWLFSAPMICFWDLNQKNGCGLPLLQALTVPQPQQYHLRSWLVSAMYNCFLKYNRFQSFFFIFSNHFSDSINQNIFSQTREYNIPDQEVTKDLGPLISSTCHQKLYGKISKQTNKNKNNLK